jgi:hypothetical protein
MTCPKVEWVKTASGQRICRTYSGDGSCSRKDEFMCVEWLKAQKGKKRGQT